MIDDNAAPEIHFVSAEDVRPLRRAVLRVGMPDAGVEFDGDDEPRTFHLAAVDAQGRVVAVSSWMSRAWMDDAALDSVQIRGMATSVSRQNTGLGGILLETGMAHCRERGVGLVWANARDTALGFYERHGFQVVGDGFIESVTRLAHHRVMRTL